MAARTSTTARTSGKLRSHDAATRARSWSAPAARRVKASTIAQRLDFSNYGGRVDVQGWGRKVATLDYGDLQRCDDGAIATTRRVRRHVERVADRRGCCRLLQSYAKQQGRVLAPAKSRPPARTGTPQTSDPRSNDRPASRSRPRANAAALTLFPSSAGRTLESHSRGLGFDPPRLHQETKRSRSNAGLFCFRSERNAQPRSRLKSRCAPAARCALLA